MKILKRKPSKICPVCKKKFFREGKAPSKWNIQIYCSRKCVRTHKNIHQHIKDNSLLVPSGCIEWQRSSHKGYGNISYLSKSWLIHRLMWTLEKGKIPKGFYVLHKCDNPKCCNIEHLFLGTQQDNMTDMAQKGRWRGVGGVKKLNYDLILKSAKNGFYTYKEIANQFKCSTAIICRIARENGVHRGIGHGKRRSSI